MTTMTKDLIIVPVFNEENHVHALVMRIRDAYPEGDLLVIDDGSTDRTREEIEKAGVSWLCHPFNLGYGVAVQTGYKYALGKDYEYLLQIDGDGQHDPAYIPIMFREIKTTAYDIVIGSRFLMPGSYRMEALKMAAIKLFRAIIKFTTGQLISDPTSGYQVMNRRVFRYFTADDFPTDYPDANIIIALHNQGFKISEVPVLMVANSEGRSMHRGFFNIIYYFFRVFLAIFITTITKKKKRIEGEEI